MLLLAPRRAVVRRTLRHVVANASSFTLGHGLPSYGVVTKVGAVAAWLAAVPWIYERSAAMVTGIS